ncbi:MAG TPA: sensor histidine kinase [Rhizomicrobium sp.]|jgi:signal transduction histidine kinase|nr:sensor histidine kinase [Rhizomicrobium sp.]
MSDAFPLRTIGWSQLSARQSRAAIAVLAILLTLAVGCVDYASGTGISMSAYYLVPLALAAWYLGPRFAVALMALGMTVWVPANLYNGYPTLTGSAAVAWNGTVQLISDVIVVFTVARLHGLQTGLEARVRERAAALTREITERERVQEELLQVSEREQRRIGRDLHDGLCQHLAATALSCQLLREELAEQGSPGATRARKIVELIEGSIRLSRQSARGLDPVAMDAEGLMAALEEMTSTMSDLFRIPCTFECESPVLIHDGGVAEHLYRIAQEAVRNAVAHSQASRIAVTLEATDNGLELRVEDDGIGLQRVAARSGGMGLRIMPSRARLIGAEFSVGRRPGGGTIVACVLPQSVETARNERERATV